MTQEITVVPVDNRTADWPRKVATVLNRLQRTTMLAGGSAVWGSITGTLSDQTDLNSALSGKQATLVSGTNIKSVNGSSLLGSGNLIVGTVTSVAASVPTGFSIAGSPITGSGTLAISFSAGYSLPTDAAQTNWNTAFGWGNHASAGYLTSSAIGATVQAYDAQLDSLAALSYSGNANKVVRVNAGATGFELATVSSGSLADGDYGDITVGGSGTTLTIDNDVVTYAKMQNVSATSRILGRKTASAGDPEECTLSEILDFIGSAAQGDILYRGASSWARLGAGTSGQVLQTNGAGANPSWATPSGSGGAWTKIAEVSLGSPAAQIDFTSISGSYTDLSISFHLGCTTTNAVTSLLLRFNSDTGSNYDWHWQSSSSLGQTSIKIGEIPPAKTSGTVDGVVAGEIEIFRYASTSLAKITRSNQLARYVTSGGFSPAAAYTDSGGFWNNTGSAITSIRLFPSANNFSTGSIATLYGRT